MAPERIIYYYYYVLVLLIWREAMAAAASSHAVVPRLPGLSGQLPFHLETGYVGVGESEQVQLFYYFVKSETNPDKDPVVLWLTGGPGCSALSGLVFEIGPMKFKVVEYDGSLPSLVLNPNSWTQVASIIFVDMPVGTGFSYATTKEAYRSGDFLQIQQADDFFRKWLIDHPEFISNPIYVGGDSYSGLIVPGVVATMSDSKISSNMINLSFCLRYEAI
ncbi:Serine carboxypeptidase-like 18 [Linum perenne]